MMDPTDRPSEPSPDIPPAPLPGALSVPWWRELNRYHWFVFVVAVLGWLFDCLDQQLFVLSRHSAMSELVLTPSERERLKALNKQETLNEDEKKERAAITATTNEYANYATAIFLFGWASGGLIFGVLGDRIGRVKTMVLTILVYSLFTGLSAISVGFWDFSLYRLLTGLGVGGEFAVGASLVAEVMPDRARPRVLSLLQAFSAIGNITAALISMSMGALEQAERLESGWRPMYLIGAVPALLALVIRYRLKEPERWQRASHEDAVAQQLGSYRALFSHPVWRRNALVGLGLACAGVIGLWAVGFFTPDLTQSVLQVRFQRQGLSESEIRGQLLIWAGVTGIMMNIGAAIGMYGFGTVAQGMGRRPAFAIALIAAFISTVSVFWFLNEFHQIFWMVPILGICQLSLFAGYAIYFPELFPTHLRSTGISFCYNVGRYVAVFGLGFKGVLTGYVFAATEHPIRYAGITMSLIFLLGLLLLPFAPETKDQPLPE